MMLREIKKHSNINGVLTHHFHLDEQTRFQGLYREWHENGAPRLECTFIDDRQEGEYKKWYENGILHVCCYHKNNRLHGEYREWDSFGNLTDTYFFADDENITDNVIAYSDNPVMIKLKFGINVL